MDFFEHQDKAKKETGRLVVLMALGVIAIVLTVYPVIAVAAYYLMYSDASEAPSFGAFFWNPMLIGPVFFGVIFAVGLGSLNRVWQLSEGGKVIAEQLGGRLLQPGATDLTEHRLLNVVEEMAIASGVPVPPVYILDNEPGINAFAAGHSPSDAVIGVTRGCAELLDRDELQGVMAHEFSHILNGDMRLNIRLIGIVFGILVLAMIGSMILRGLFHSRAAVRVSRSRKGDKGGNIVLVIAAVAALLVVIGSVGAFFGKLIKAAVSRQREFLADAAAVQFTRNPDGIGSALKKIGGYAYHAKLEHPQAEEASHMYFGEGVSHWLGDMMATHPPLQERISRVLPHFDGEFPNVEPPEGFRKKQKKKRWKSASAGKRSSRTKPSRSGAVASLAGPPPIPLIGQIGQPTNEHVSHAASLLRSLDDRIRAAAREPYVARGVVFALLLDRDESVRQRQFAALRRHADERVVAATEELMAPVARMDPNARLPVIDLALS